MTDKQRKKRWKTILTIVTLVALVGTAFALRHQIYETINNLGKVNTWAVLLIIPLEVLNYIGQAKLYKGLFRLLGDRFKTKSMFGLALELNFVNNVFPSGGVSGFSYLSLRMKGEGVSTAKATLVQMMRFIMVFVSFQVLLSAGLFMLAIVGDASKLTILVSGSLASLLLAGTLLVAYVVGSKQRINDFFTFITRLLNGLIHLVRPKHPETINISRARHTFTELHENYLVLKRRIKELKKPLLYALLANVTEIAAIYVVYLAFGHAVNPGAVIIAYAIANFAGLVSVLPGGIGIYEALMTGVLAAGGVPPAISLPVTVMYRVVNMAVQLPPGYYLYHRALHAKAELPE
ncbi:MAG TPA: lysylphosphatidylglycerol synthase transmembrane domain-containing protein [Candidatus Limnocylindrales bacterium]|nr:lysylphosphatidylglycerol synthase transmembrane domain-containing protein [Candidatus Limnocylindrales bacterium]